MRRLKALSGALQSGAELLRRVVVAKNCKLKVARRKAAWLSREGLRRR